MSLREEADSMYTPLAEAVAELQRRQRASGLRRAVVDFCKGEVFSVFEDSSQLKGWMGRHIASPNWEYLLFIRLSRRVALQPVFGEFTIDDLRYSNSDKYALTRLGTTGKMQKRHRFPVRQKHLPVIDMNAWEGKRLCDVQCLNGESLVDFHHSLFGVGGAPQLPPISPAAPLFNAFGGRPAQYYPPYLAQFIAHGILFENFRTEGFERPFTENIVLPAFRAVEQEFGLRPLIVPIVPSKCDCADFLSAYPRRIYQHAWRKIKEK